MFDYRMIGVSNDPGKPNFEIELSQYWVKFLDLQERVVDVGDKILVYASILSEFEARQRNEQFKITVTADLQQEIGQGGLDSSTLHMSQGNLESADKIEELLDAIQVQPPFYSWVIVERSSID